MKVVKKYQLHMTTNVVSFFSEAKLDKIVILSGSDMKREIEK